MTFDKNPSLVSLMNSTLQTVGVAATCVAAEQHRHLAHFDVKLNAGTTVSKLESNIREISLGIKSKTVPIVTVMPHLGVVRLQAAMSDAEVVSHSELFNDVPKDMVLPFVIGEDAAGKVVWMDMVKNPHLLIAGGTGSGKSTLIHTLIANALYLSALRYRQIELFLVDPKRIELGFYSDFNEVRCLVNSLEDTIKVLKHLNNVMEYRYKVMEEKKIRSFEHDQSQFPAVLLVIDEAADLILQDKKKEFQTLLVSLAQKGRAAGIYIILATQRPSVNVITGTIKANFPARIACRTASRTDSMVILDEVGAETLLGRGDAVLKNMVHDRVRFQVAYTDENEIRTTYNEMMDYYDNYYQLAANE